MSSPGLSQNSSPTCSTSGTGCGNQTHHVARKVTGIGGDADFDKLSESEARKRFPKAF